MSGVPQNGPLSGLRVLDFSTLLPGPFATLMLADMGAEVVHVESPNRVDMVRVIPPYADGTSTAHAYLNRNKASLALDLKDPASIALIEKCIAEYDIVVEQFRPGVMDRLGLGYERLSQLNPRVVYCSITGYGQTGPLKDRAGHDINYLALSGIAGHSGRQDAGPPPLGIQVADVAGGSLHAVIGILAAVVERQRTGIGQHIDISMTDCAFALNSMAAAAQLAGHQPQRPEAGILNGGSFYDYYRTADGQYLAIGSLEPQFMQVLCDVVGHPEWLPLGLSQNTADQQQLQLGLRNLIASAPLSIWQQRLAGRDACIEPVLSLEEACSSELAQARGWIADVPNASGGFQRQPAFAIKFSRSQPAYHHIGKPLGADNPAFLATITPDSES